ncbi:ligand-binding sensor domain-containing protein [Bacteroides sedimenti]
MRNNRKIVMVFFVMIAFYAHSQTKWTECRISNAFSPGNDICSIQFDKDNNMWVGTWNGIYKFGERQWEQVGPANAFIHDFYIDKQNVKWIGLWGGGLYRSDDDKHWTQITDIKPAGCIFAINGDRNGNVWVGDWNCGVYSFINGRWNSYKKDEINLGDSTVTSISSDSKNNIWFGTYHGLTVYNESGRTKLYNKTNSKLPDNDVYSLCADSKNGIWIGTTNGLARFNGKDWLIYKKEDSCLPSNLILCIAEDQKGFIWAGTDKGVVFFNGKNWTTYSIENSPLVDNRVQTITVHQDRIYIGTSKGISIVEYD